MVNDVRRSCSGDRRQADSFFSPWRAPLLRKAPSRTRPDPGTDTRLRGARRDAAPAAGRDLTRTSATSDVVEADDCVVACDALTSAGPTWRKSSRSRSRENQQGEATVLPDRHRPAWRKPPSWNCGPSSRSPTSPLFFPPGLPRGGQGDAAAQSLERVHPLPHIFTAAARLSSSRPGALRQPVDSRCLSSEFRIPHSGPRI